MKVVTASWWSDKLLDWVSMLRLKSIIEWAGWRRGMLITCLVQRIDFYAPSNSRRASPYTLVVQVIGVARLFEFSIQGSNQLRLAADRIAELLDSLTMDATIDAFTYAHVWRLDYLGQSPDVALVGTKMRSGEKAPVHWIIVKGGVAE